MTQSELDDLRDRIYVLESAIEDVTADLPEADTADDLRRCIAWLIECAQPLVGGLVAGEPGEST